MGVRTVARSEISLPPISNFKKCKNYFSSLRLGERSFRARGHLVRANEFSGVLDDFSFLDRHCIFKTREPNLLRNHCKNAQFLGVGAVDYSTLSTARLLGFSRGLVQNVTKLMSQIEKCDNTGIWTGKSNIPRTGNIFQKKKTISRVHQWKSL